MNCSSLLTGLPDVMKAFRPFEAISPAHLPIPRHASQRRRIEIQDDMFDVLPVGGLVIVAEDRQTAFLSREPSSEARAVFTRRTLRHVHAIALHLPIDGAADIDDAIDQLRAACEVLLLFAHAVWLQSRLELLDVIAARPRHPAR